MSSPTQLPTLGLKRIVGFWLTILIVGSIPIFLYNIFEAHGFSESLLLTVTIMLTTAILSLPSLLLLYLLIPWALESPVFVHRWLRLATVQSISAGITFWLVYSTILDNHVARNIPSIACSYFVAGLLAAYWRYSTWLKRTA
jgi:hypothetical protein